MQHDDEYGRLVVGCLQSFGLLCLGLYRLLLSDTNQRRQKRYVITNPPSSFRLLPSDKVLYSNGLLLFCTFSIIHVVILLWPCVIRSRSVVAVSLTGIFLI